jgi:hypothetical protein
MFPLRPANGPHARTANHHVMMAWDKIVTIALGVMLLAMGTLFLPHVTTHLGPFSTLFIAVVVVGSVVMHIREQTSPPESQS